jgi:hypothetical protein
MVMVRQRLLFQAFPSCLRSVVLEMPRTYQPAITLVVANLLMHDCDQYLPRKALNFLRHLLGNGLATYVTKKGCRGLGISLAADCH